MTENRTYAIKSLPVANYRSAIARAVEWLGDRYLLAKPINSAAHAQLKGNSATTPIPLSAPVTIATRPS
jgi:hypothetical protein